MTPEEQRIFAIEALIATIDAVMRTLDKASQDMQEHRRALFEAQSKLRRTR
jgi:hypothetical protein